MIDSRKMNKEFARQVKSLSMSAGIDEHVARNILRYRKGLKKNNVSPVWTNPKTKLPLTVAEWAGPAETLRRKVANGTTTAADPLVANVKNLHESVDGWASELWDACTCIGMYYTKANVLLSRQDCQNLIHQHGVEIPIIDSMMEE